MSKLRLFILHFAPLWLKFRGRIVGAVSRRAMTIYIASGLLIVSSMLLVIAFLGMKSYPDTIVEPEKNIENKVTQPVEDQPVVKVVSPQAMPEPASKAMVDIQPAQDVLVVPKAVKGPIKVDFGWQQHEVYKDWRYHTGIDISGSVGQPVEAIYNGQVGDIFRDKHNGLTVVVKNSTYSVYYGSLSEVKVEKSSFVNPGQIIGTMGSCDAEPFNHLHLGLKKGDQYIDPKLVISRE